MQKTTKKGRMSKIYSLSPDCIFSIKEIAAHCKCSESYALEMAMEKALNWYRKKWAREELTKRIGNAERKRQRLIEDTRNATEEVNELLDNMGFDIPVKGVETRDPK